MVGFKAAKAATKVGKIATNGNGILPTAVHQHGVTTHTPMLGTTQVGIKAVNAAKPAKATNGKRFRPHQHGLTTHTTELGTTVQRTRHGASGDTMPPIHSTKHGPNGIHMHPRDRQNIPRALGRIWGDRMHLRFLMSTLGGT